MILRTSSCKVTAVPKRINRQARSATPRQSVLSRVVRVSRQAEAVKEIQRPGTIVLIGSEAITKRVQFLCPCGCADAVSLNLLQEIGPAWRIAIDEKDRVSISPSIRRQSGCRSHFVLFHGIARLLSRGHYHWDVRSKGRRQAAPRSPSVSRGDELRNGAP